MSQQEMKHIMKRYEEKLKSLMPKAAFQRFVVEVAKETFHLTVEGMESGDFKEFCLENFDTITGEKS